METAEPAAGLVQHGAVEAYTLPCAAGPSGGGGSDSLVTKFASLQRALTSELGNTVGVQVHQKWAPWYVAQIQAPAKTTGKIHSQWLPVYEKKEDAALAYDIANTWRALRGICGITEQNARFNFPTAGYLADEQLRAVLAPLSTFPEVNDLIKRELLPPRPFPTQLRQTATADKVQQAGVRSSRAAALQAGSVWVDLTAAKLRDCRVYLKPDAVNQAFRGAADDAGRELADGYSWAELRVQATAVDPGNGEQRVFELFFGTPGRDGLPVVPASLRPLLDLLGAQPGDMLQLQYQGRQGSAVQVAASLVPRHAASPSPALPHGNALSQGEQLGAAEAAAELLGLRRSEAEPPPILQVSAQQGAAPPAAGTQAATAMTAAGLQRKRGWSDGDDVDNSRREPAVSAKRRMLDQRGSSAGPTPPSPAAAARPLYAKQRPPEAACSLQAGAGSERVAADQAGTRTAGLPAYAASRGTGGAATRDAVQQAAAVLAAAQDAEEHRRPLEQMRAVLHTLQLVGVEDVLRVDFSVFFEKLPPAVQDVQVLILEGLLREQDAARLVARHVRRKVLSSPQELPLPQTESMHGWPPPDI